MDVLDLTLSITEDSQSEKGNLMDLYIYLYNVVFSNPPSYEFGCRMLIEKTQKLCLFLEREENILLAKKEILWQKNVKLRKLLKKKRQAAINFKKKIINNQQLNLNTFLKRFQESEHVGSLKNVTELSEKDKNSEISYPIGVNDIYQNASQTTSISCSNDTAYVSEKLDDQEMERLNKKISQLLNDTNEIWRQVEYDDSIIYIENSTYSTTLACDLMDPLTDKSSLSISQSELLASQIRFGCENGSSETSSSSSDSTTSEVRKEEVIEYILTDCSETGSES